MKSILSLTLILLLIGCDPMISEEEIPNVASGDKRQKILMDFELIDLQDSICSAIENSDGKAKFIQDNWTRKGGGGGRTRVIQDGSVIDKGGVNWSGVEGELPDNIQRALGLESKYFFATGVSIVMHPVNPMVPIIHMNVRYFETRKNKNSPIIEDSWFGGGIDLSLSLIHI